MVAVTWMLRIETQASLQPFDASINCELGQRSSKSTLGKESVGPHLREHLVSVLIFVEEHSNIGLVPAPPLQFAKLAVHGIHGEKSRRVRKVMVVTEYCQFAWQRRALVFRKRY